jgi:hypothetical protein
LQENAPYTAICNRGLNLSNQVIFGNPGSLYLSTTIIVTIKLKAHVHKNNTPAASSEKFSASS